MHVYVCVCVCVCVCDVNIDAIDFAMIFDTWYMYKCVYAYVCFYNVSSRTLLSVFMSIFWSVIWSLLEGVLFSFAVYIDLF